MLEITLLKKYEGKLAASGNPIEVSAVVTPFLNASMFVIVTVSVQAAPASPVYNIIKSQKLVVGLDGFITMDIASLADPYLEHFVPPPNLDNVVVCDKQIRNFRITMDLYNPLVSQAKVATVEDYVRVLKGGFSYEYNRPEVGSFTLKDEGMYLLGLTQRETVFTNDVFFIFILTQSIATESEQLESNYTITYENADGTIATIRDEWYPNRLADFENKVLCFPAGFNQNDFGSLLPSGATPISYSIEFFKMIDGVKTNGRLAPITFNIEQRNFYKRRQLLYRTSLGSLMPVSMRGTIEHEAAYESQVTNTRPLSWIKDRNVVGTKAQGITTEDYKFKGETGFITELEANRLRDFFLSRERYEYIDGRLVPIIVNSKNVKYFTNRDSLYSIAIEWQHAFSNNYNTRRDVNTNFCPPVSNFFWKQNFDNSIQVFWQLADGFNFIRVTIQFPDEPNQEYFIEGNSGSATIQFNRPASASGSVDIDVFANTACNYYNKVRNFSTDFTTPTQTLSPGVAATANDDIYQLATGHSTGVVLSPSVLANDFDPNGGTLAVIPQVAQPTTAGGIVSINAAGIVTYTPPSPTYTGTDTVTYQMQVNGTGTLYSATIRFNVSAVPSSSVYASASYDDFQQVFFQNVAYSIYINLWNGPGGIVPVNGSNLTVNYRRTVKLYSAVDNYTTPTSTTNTDATVIMNGISRVKVFSGPTDEFVADGSGFFTIRKVTSVQVLPGAGYTPL